MTLTITLTADPVTRAGVDFNGGYNAFFDGFSPYGFPFFLGPTSTRTTQVAHIDTPTAGREQETRAVLLGGDDFLYTFSNHSVSGTIRSIQLVELGAAYNQTTGGLNLNNGIVTQATQHITITGLDMTNAPGVKGEVHNVIAGLMGGGPDGTLADPSPITTEIWSQGHVVNGSSGADRYSGTRFADTIRGNAGNDTLLGNGGFDKIIGGLGKDTMTGGAGGDTFIFNSLADAVGDSIRDFARGQNDRIQLTAIDANANRSGNQAFTFIGSEGFHGVAGELRYRVGNTTTAVVGDVDGDGVSDFSISLVGKIQLTAGDFLL